jgi:hypothetical protein
MSKGKGPRKRRQPAPEQPPADDEKEIERQTEAKAELIPPAWRPPTALGADTPSLPPREPPGAPLPARVQRQPFGLVEFVNALRDALGKLLDLADATADAITKGRA